MSENWVIREEKKAQITLVSGLDGRIRWSLSPKGEALGKGQFGEER